jgi:hypothetical protein
VNISACWSKTTAASRANIRYRQDGTTGHLIALKNIPDPFSF